MHLTWFLEPESNPSTSRSAELAHQHPPLAASTAVQSNDDSDLASQRKITTPVSLDPENQTGTSHRASEDPYGLSTKLKSSVEIYEMKHGLSRQSSFSNPVSKDANKARILRRFYKSQNENIERFLKPIHEHRRQAKEEQDDTSTQFRLAFYGSFVANICLAFLQVFGAVFSGSLSLFTTAADAIFDPCSNLTLILCRRAIKRVDQRKYPQGKARIETAGNITFCFLMTSVSFVILALSAKELADGSETLTTDFHWPSVMAVGIAIVTKFVLFLYCGALRKRFSQINILYKDHRNDLIINTVGLATSILGSKVRWWIDPMGAICLSVLISGLWLSTAWSEFQLLIGRSADTALLQHITYICKHPLCSTKTQC